MQDVKITRIILAAGAGSRMGRIKALLPLDGATALARISALSLPGFTLDTVVVGGFEAGCVAAEAARASVRFVTHDRWQSGQTGSVGAGIRSAPGADYFLLHPVDLPLIEQQDYAALAQAMTRHPGRSLYVTSIDQRRGHPIVFSAALAQEILTLGDDDSIRPVMLRAADVVYAEVTNPWVRKDLDTVEDYEEARGYLADNGESTSP